MYRMKLALIIVVSVNDLTDRFIFYLVLKYRLTLLFNFAQIEFVLP